MAATGTLPYYPSIRKSGVLVLSGFGIRVSVHAGHLIAHDGIADQRRTIRMPRVNHGLKRLVIIGSDGFVTLEALRWLADQDAAFVMLRRDGKILCVTGPVRPSDSKLRRSQALAHSSGAALHISRELIARKLSAQEDVARHKLLDTSTAATIARFRAELPSANSINTVRLIESQAARCYWYAWSTLPINFPKNQLPCLPAHWLSFGARVSPLTGSPRLACNPPNAALNFLYSLAEAEARLAAACLGMDPGLGVLHTDTAARDSLACDLMEPVRPHVDAYVLEWITKQILNREWFSEQRDGNCRLMADFAARLSETAYIWRRHVAPVAEWVARAFWQTIRRPDAPFATRLTQSNKRVAKGAQPTQITNKVQPENVCCACGASVSSGRKYCPDCEVTTASERMVEIAKAGRIAAQAVEPRKRMAATQRKHALARFAWNQSDLPAWLTEETYWTKIQPLLKNIANPVIMSALGVSVTYAVAIRAGRRRPHPRHWRALAKIVGVSGPCPSVSGGPL